MTIEETKKVNNAEPEVLQKFAIYRKLYEIIKENYVNSGTDVPFGFHEIPLCENKNEVDLFEWIDLDNEDFLKMSFIRLLHRYPDDGALTNWSNRIRFMKKTDFQRKVIRELMDSEEFKICNTALANNIYSIPDKGK